MNNYSPSFGARIYNNDFFKVGVCRAKSMASGGDASAKQAQLFLSELQALNDVKKVNLIVISEDMKFPKDSKPKVQFHQNVEFDFKKVLEGRLNDDKMSDRCFKMIDLLFSYLVPSHLAEEVREKVAVTNLSPGEIVSGLSKFG